MRKQRKGWQRRKKQAASRAKHGARHLAEHGSGVSRLPSLNPVDEHWLIDSSRTPGEHSHQFAMQLKYEMDSGALDASVQDGAREAIRQGLAAVERSSLSSAPAMGGKGAYSLARVMYVTLSQREGQTVALGTIGVGMREAGCEAELARLQRRFRVEWHS